MIKIKTRDRIVGRFAAAAMVCALFAGCAATHRGRSVEQSGFLGDYSLLQPTENKDQALLRYVDNQTDFRQYNKILLDPIKAYAGVGDGALRKMKPEDLQKMLDYLDSSIRNELGQSYQFVTKPEPGTIRMRIALTEAKGARVPLDLVSSVMPPGIALNALKTIATGRGTGIGETSIEFEGLDAMTGKRLMAAVDKRVGNKYTGRFDKFDRWRATKGAFDWWVTRLKSVLEQSRIQK